MRETFVEDRAERDIGRLAAALGDPTRRRVFFAVRSAGREQTKDEIGATVGIDRRLAGFHLDKLVEHGFLEAGFRRPDGRSGPGAGRPAKHYRLADAEVLVALPERHYDLLAALLLRATKESGPADPQEVLERVGHDFGFEVGLAEVAAGRSAPGRLPDGGDGGRGAGALALRLRGPRRGRGRHPRLRVPVRGARVPRPGADLRPGPRDLAGDARRVRPGRGAAGGHDPGRWRRGLRRARCAQT